MLRHQDATLGCRSAHTTIFMQERMEADAHEIGSIIASHLGIKPGIAPCAFAFGLAHRWSNRTSRSDNENVRAMGGMVLFVGGFEPECARIFVSDQFQVEQVFTVLLHEAVHVILFSEWFEYLNVEMPWINSYPTDEFHEMVARAVERRYVESGGADIRASFIKSSRGPLVAA